MLSLKYKNQGCKVKNYQKKFTFAFIVFMLKFVDLKKLLSTFFSRLVQ
jgi:hypothetical protein